MRDKTECARGSKRYPGREGTMTYKAIVMDFVERDAEHFLDHVLTENGIDYIFISREGDVKMEPSKEYKTIFWDVTFDVYRNRTNTSRVRVGGTVDTTTGICCSCIYDSAGAVVWMSTEGGRKTLGIDRLII